MQENINVINRILQEHKEILRELNEVSERIENLLGKVQDLSFHDISHIIGKVTYLITLILDHESLEEKELYPIFEDLGYIVEVEKLRNDHKQITQYLNSIRWLFERYARREIDLKSLLNTVTSEFSSLHPLFKEHVALEEKIIKILIARRKPA